jgi:hypothetical protein
MTFAARLGQVFVVLILLLAAWGLVARALASWRAHRALKRGSVDALRYLEAVPDSTDFTLN